MKKHKNTNALLILIVCAGGIFCMLAKHIISNFSRFFEVAKHKIIKRKNGKQR
jgi:hypothetical protein